MRVAIIDLGTNSVRFDVHQLGPGKLVKQLHREKLMVRLGQGVFVQGKLDPAAVRRTLQAFLSFQSTAQSLQVDKIISFATSALREATDSNRLLKQIEAKTGIQVRVISGVEEAKLIALGVLSNEKLPKNKFALVDIGGGSTEMSICRGREILHTESFALGTARLQQVFLKSSPPKAPTSHGEAHPIDQLRRYVKSVVLPKMIAEEWPKVDTLIGSSGTIKAISKILKKMNLAKGPKGIIEKESLKKLVRLMAGMNTTQLLGLPGMEAKRVDMILAGAILLEECVEALRAKRVIATEYSLRDGILTEEIQVVHQQKGSHIDLHFDELIQKAMKLGSSETHINQVTKSCEYLFDQLKSVHKLPAKWKPYLKAAAILHDVGEAITPTHHETHSYYIVKNANFSSMENWEVEFIAQLCLRHRSTGKISLKDLKFEANKEMKSAFLRLLSLLRIADALDRSHNGLVSIKSIKVTSKTVTIKLKSKGSADLEILRLEQKKELFESVFDRALQVER